ncbi:MAG: OB-fold domain-containing protein [Variibacter sp.]|nr:OB-fold domain-containing protein [Variibacter sp.]
MAEPKLMDERTGRYLPLLHPEEKEFWAGTKRREIRLQCCSACGKTWYPIGPTCPFCLSDKYEWKRMSGRGTVSNVVIFHKGWTPYLVARLPYAVVQVELEEGPRLTTNMLDIDPHAVKIGMKVEAAYEDVTEEVTLVQFRPA